MGYLTDIGIIIGIVLVILSFRKKYKPYRFTLITTGVLLLAAGFYFLDYEALKEGFEAGRAYGENKDYAAPKVSITE